MRPQPLALALLFAITPAVLAAPAYAQADDAATKTARARFQEGVTAFDKGQYEAARLAFLQAYALRKHPAVLLNLGQSSLKAGRPLDASRYLQQFLREAKDAGPAQREAAEKSLAEARAKLGRIDVFGAAGGEVSVDNERIGTLPLDDAFDVEPGTHSVRVRGPDGKEESQDVGVRAGDRATIRFAPGSSPVPPPPSPEATPPAPTASAPAEPTATLPPPRDPPTSDEPSSPGLFSPPESMTPVWIAGGISLVGLGLGIAFGVQRDVAQTNANKVDAQIRDAGGGTGTCSSTEPRVVASYGDACNVLADNRRIVDLDATVANVGFVVAGVGAATALGFYLFGAKEGEHSSASGSAQIPKVAPLVGLHVAGITLAGTWR